MTNQLSMECCTQSIRVKWSGIILKFVPHTWLAWEISKQKTNGRWSLVHRSLIFIVIYFFMSLNFFPPTFLFFVLLILLYRFFWILFDVGNCQIKDFVIARNDGWSQPVLWSVSQMPKSHITSGGFNNYAPIDCRRRKKARPTETNHCWPQICKIWPVFLVASLE